MRLEQYLEVLKPLAPENLAEPWDNVGLLVGDPAWRVRGVLLCIDLGERVLDEAIAAGATLVIAYHPPIFSPFKSLTATDPKQRIILRAAQRKIAIYSPHTALDAVAGGVNDWLCDGLGTGDRLPIRSAPGCGPDPFKLVTFVPHDQADRLREALSDTGAGVIGGYTRCSFGVAGQGTFYGGASTSPAVGARGRLERVDELRVEMVCPGRCLSRAIAALREVHPYEEPAFDIYRLEASPESSGAGQGRIVTLSKSIALATLVKRVKRHLGIEHLEVAASEARGRISRIGLCAGAGGSLRGEAGGVDAFITGEMRHHEVLAARAAGVTVLLAGHTQTERPYLKIYRQRIRESMRRAGVKPIPLGVSKADQPPTRLR